MNSLALKDNPVLNCNWDEVLAVANSMTERNRVKKINANTVVAQYPLTREYLNNYYNTHKFSFSSYESFPYDCSSAMYSYWLMTFGYEPGNPLYTLPSPLPAKPGAMGGVGLDLIDILPGILGMNILGLPLWLWLIIGIAGYKVIND